MENRTKTILIVVSVMSAIIFASISTFIITFSFLATHFYPNTKINGVNCSFSTAKQAQKKINKQISANEICIRFAGNVEYRILGKNIDLCLEDTKELERILKSKDLRKLLDQKEYILEESFSFNEKKLINYLKTIPEFNKKIVVPKNAYLSFDEKSHKIRIMPEIEGNINDIEKAFAIAKNNLQNGEILLDFTVYPEIREKDEALINQQNKMNQILTTTIHYQLRNGKTETLDWSNWAKKNKKGNWEIEINNNLNEFVKSLNKKINEMNVRCTFKTTGRGNITLPLRSSLREKLNTDEETKRIKQLLGTGKNYQVEPIYIENTYQDALSNYLEIDLTRQKVWLYRNGKCIVSGNCVSGSVAGGHSTPTGMYYLDYKTTNTYLRGRNNDGSKYNSFVNYWMPFNGGVGLHDAIWRNQFGGTIYRYNGSHGCINLPYSVARKIYENINYKTLIIVYKS